MRFPSKVMEHFGRHDAKTTLEEFFRRWSLGGEMLLFDPDD